MGKIRSLTDDEAARLRSSLLEAYLVRFGRVFTPVTYLGAYADFRDMLLSGLPGEPGLASSISTHRLRKLFYYTDPAVCPSGQLEPLSFGDDFISLLEKFCRENTEGSDGDMIIGPLTAPRTKRSRTMVYLFSSILLALFVILSYTFYSKTPYSFRDDFHFNSVDDLKERGWDFIDFDSSLFYPQDTGVLTLRSARGDYWVRPYDTPYIHNVVYRELPRGCFEVTTKFTFPNNFEAYQQCGLFFLDNNKSRSHNIRITWAKLTEKELNRGFQIVKRVNGEATQYIHHSQNLTSDTFNYVFYIKILKDKTSYNFYAHRYESTSAFDHLTTMLFDFEPKYLALASFNGYRVKDLGPLNTAGSIPAKFDWVRVEGCE